MNLNKIIIEALAPLKLPVYAGFMDADAERSAGRPVPDEYITFVYDESPILHGDDADLCNVCGVTFNYFTSGNPLKVKKAIRRLLRRADFLITNTPQELYEADTKKHHIIVEADYYSDVDDADDNNSEE